MVSDSGEWLSSSFQWGWKENIAIFCWAIWGARNKKVWQQKCSADIEVVSTAWSVLDQWSNAWIRCHSSSLVDLSQGGDAEQWVLSCKIRSRLTLMVPISKKKKKTLMVPLLKQKAGYGFGCVVRNRVGGSIWALADSRAGRVQAYVEEAKP